MILPKQIERFFYRRPGFWFFQITGWIAMFIQDVFSGYDTLVIDKAPYFLVISLFCGFCITLLLRRIYRFFYNQRRSILFYILVLAISSILGGSLWFLFRFFVITPIHEIVTLGSGYELMKWSVYEVSLRILNFSWPLTVWSTLYFGLKFWIDLLDARDKFEKALLLAQKSQLQMLRYQLNPHFLFNSLNSIQALVYEDPRHADKMITELAEFLRFALRDKDKLFVPLREEAEVAERYLSMEQTRFPDRLKYSINVTEEAADVRVIAFLLQPFVENAIKHGMKSAPDNFSINIDCHTKENKLYIKIENTGVWIESSSNTGTGIQNVFDRLNNAYPGKYQLNIIKNAGSVCVMIEIIFAKGDENI
ncbi:MAG: histidine kinase [Bacteroidales bacterium]|jgi:hypothetical protein